MTNRRENKTSEQGDNRTDDGTNGQGDSGIGNPTNNRVNNQINGNSNGCTNGQINVLAATNVPVWLPPPVVMFIMRLLAFSLLLMSMFLVFTHIAAKMNEVGATVPFCSGLSWVDCESVLNSRYAVIFSIPVAAFAGVLYFAILVTLITFNSKRSKTAAWFASWLLCSSSAAIIISAVWFTYIQIYVLQRLCSYCMIEHIVGFILAIFMLTYGMVLCRPIRHAAIPIGTMAAFILIAGQYFYQPRYIETVTWSDTDQCWIDGGREGSTTESSPTTTSLDSPLVKSESSSSSADSSTDLISYFDGNIRLRAELHPVIGLAEAKHFIIEVTDFTCPRCAMFANLFEQARSYLGPDYAVIVVFWPLNTDCNSVLVQQMADNKVTEELSQPSTNYSNSNNDIYANACEFTRLATAVWLADSTAYSLFHNWLFENQGSISSTVARRRAEVLVGSARLDAALNDSRLDILLKRDLMLTKRLKVGQLPGIVVGSSRLSGIPEDPVELAELITEMVNTE